MLKGFPSTLLGRAVCFGIVALVLVVSGVNAMGDLRTPRLVALPSFPYTQTGGFDYSVFLKPSTLYGSAPLPVAGAAQAAAEEQPVVNEEEPRHVFFRSLIDEFDMTFTYDLDTVEPIGSAEMDLEVVVYATDPGVWEKDIARFMLSQHSRPLVLNYVLELDEIEDKVKEIEEDVDIDAGNVDYRLEASVHLVAQTLSGQTIEDTYVHSIELDIRDKQVELYEPLVYSAAVKGAPFGWTHSSRFDYDVFLKWNELYDEPVLRSAGLPVAKPEQPAAPPAETEPMQVLGPGYTYFPQLVDHVDAGFAYTFESKPVVGDLSHEVGLTVTISNGDVWTKTLSLVPTRTETGDFTVSFPIDLNYYTSVIDAIGEETGARGSAHSIAITANVLTTGTTNLGRINETFTQTLQGTLEKARLTFDGETLAETAKGAVGGGTKPNEAAPSGGWQTPWLIGIALGAAGLAFLLWRESRLRAALLGPVDAEAAAIKKKYRDLMVDVRAMPPIREADTLVSLRVVHDLAKIADDSVKPVLHYSADGIHSYVVLDGSIRYEYVIDGQLHTDASSS